MAYYNQIVQLKVSQTKAYEPNTLQQTAAIVSMGGTTVPAGTTQWISSPSDLAAWAIPHYDIASISWSTGYVTLNTVNPHGVPVGTTSQIQVYNTTSSTIPSGYDGVFTATATSTTQLSYALAANPGTATILGQVETGSQLWLEAADEEWWAQGNLGVGYYIYETGTAVISSVLSSVQNYLNANPQTIYNWQFLPGVDADHTDAKAFFLLNNSLTSLVKFYLPVTLSTYASWAVESTLRNVFAMIQTPSANLGVEATEVDSVAFMQYMTAFVPSSTNRLPPSQYTFLNGVTAYSPITNSQINTYVNGNINFVATGAEGGISNTILVAGKNLDGTPANVAYSIDWVQIQSNLAISNEVINGSNNPLAPLYYNQNGIDRLQQVVAGVGNLAISSGLSLGQVVQVELDPNVFATNVGLGVYNGNFVINAVPFSTYVKLQPSDYANQIYRGLQVAYTPQYGFQTIVFNLNVTQFA